MIEEVQSVTFIVVTIYSYAYYKREASQDLVPMAASGFSCEKF